MSEAFHQAWSLLKMPLYHGTTEEAWNKIQQEGLKPTDHAPQLYEMEEEMIRGQYGDDYDRLFGGDWAFAYGDKAPFTRYWLGGKTGGIISADDWVHGEDNPVVLEIADSHPFINEPPVIDEDGTYAGRGRPFIFNEGKDQRRTNQTIPPHLIRRLSADEIQSAYDKQEQYRLMQRNTSRWIEEIIQQMLSNQLPFDDEEFDNLLGMRSRHAKWSDGRLGDYR